jgi:hypothetical protein
MAEVSTIRMTVRSGARLDERLDIDQLEGLVEHVDAGVVR